MKRIKLDENFPPSCVEIFNKHGIDASSVFHQNMQGDVDETVLEVCIKEERILITFDLDFANIIRFSAEGTEGIILSRNKRRITLANIKPLCERLARIVIEHDTKDKLFIVEEMKIRIRKPDNRIF